MISFDPTSILGIKGVGHRRYWMIGAWLKYESFFVDFECLTTLVLEGLECNLNYISLVII